MRSLFESILTSTGSGKNREVRNWIEQNLMPMINDKDNPFADKAESLEQVYSIKSDGTIDVKHDGILDFNILDSIPSFIKFGHCDGIFAFGDSKQSLDWYYKFPRSSRICLIGTSQKTLPKMTLYCTEGVKFSWFYANNLTTIEELNIDFHLKPNSNTYINFEKTKFDISQLKNIHITNGIIWSVKLHKSKIERQIRKKVSEIKKGKVQGEYEDLISDYLNEVFSTFTGLQYIDAQNFNAHIISNGKWHYR